MSYGEDAGIDFATAHGREWPSVRQFNVFLENRLGALMDLVRKFESTDIHIVALTVVDSADCAIIRLVLSDVERAREIFDSNRYAVTESDLLVVKLPEHRQPIAQICKALLSAEISINYAYSLLIGPQGNPALALHVEDHDLASNTLARMGFTIYSESDLAE